MSADEAKNAVEVVEQEEQQHEQSQTDQVNKHLLSSFLSSVQGKTGSGNRLKTGQRTTEWRI